MASFSPKECGICLNEFDESELCPKILPCSHNICEKCLHEMFRIKKKICPFCRRSFQENSLQSFGTNLHLLDALKCLKEVENKEKTTVMTNLDERFEMLTIDNYQNNEDPRDYTISSYQRNRCESPHWRGRYESSYQQDMGKTPNYKDQSDSPYQRNRDELLHHRGHRGKLPHQKDQSELHIQRYRGEPPHQRDLSELSHQTYSGEPSYQREQRELSHQLYSREPPYQRDQSELSHQRNGAVIQHKDHHKTHYQKNLEFTSVDLLKILINAEDFSISTQMIIQNHGTELDSIRRILDDCNHVFEENGGIVFFKPEIKICSYHIGAEGCHDRSSCSKLHICPNYIFFSCSDKKCILGHNIKSNQNQSVLQLFLMNELSAQQLAYILSQVIPQSTSNPTRHQNHKEASKYREDKVSMTESFQNIPQRTLWHDDYEGNTEIPEICYNSVTNKCSNEVTGCKRLHADAHFHWQVKERGVGWVNLQEAQVEILEKAYCNPSLDIVVIPPLNKNNCQRRLFNLFGSDKWEVNFKEMSLRNKGTKVKLSLRRITSQTMNGHKVSTTKYVWYFQDQNKQWVQYGKPDTTLGSSGVSSLTSDELEREYQKDPSNSITFHIFGITYILDFNTMVQMNTATNVRRAVKRRPVYHAKNNSHKKYM